MPDTLPIFQPLPVNAYRCKAQITRMVTSLIKPLSNLGNNFLRFCFILMLVMPVFAASGDAGESNHVTTVVRPDPKTGRLVRAVVVQARRVSAEEATGLEQMVDRIAG